MNAGKYIRTLMALARKARAAAQKLNDLEERVSTLETKAENAKTVLQDHEQRITTLEGG